ncbi:MAG: alpha-glucosidase [Mycobacteriales bacterium]
MHRSPESRAAAPRSAASDSDDWWRSAVFYQIYIRSFLDSDGDGVGDLGGIRDRLGYLGMLGVDGLWITPFYPSPMADHGYDVADPRGVDPLFGDLATFDALIREAHEQGLRITIDLVPNHTSDQHAWFREALQSPPGSPARQRYYFRDGQGADGSEPPNNWQSTFGGPAWTRVADGQWYLHLFAPEQPDLNWANPEVVTDFERTMRFWLDRGVDGFRLDVAHGLAKPADLPDMPAPEEAGGVLDEIEEPDPRFDQDGVHDVHRMIRRVLDSYPGRVAVGEVWVSDDERLARYVRPDELQLAFNFRLLEAGWDAGQLRAAVDDSLAAMHSVGAPTTWVLANHDRPRHVTRYGDGELGRKRARAAALVQFALPGVAFVYNGDELGLPNVDLPDDVLQDPVWERSGHKDRGRDGERVPLPWSGEKPPYDFTTGSRTWLPMPDGWTDLTVEAELENPESMLSLYRRVLGLRPKFANPPKDTLEWYGAPEGCLAFRRGNGLICALNASTTNVPLPPGEVLLTSGPLIDEMLPPDTAVWLA